MSLVDGNGGGLSAADVAAVMGNNGSNGFGFGGDGAWWLLVLFLFALSGNGWGNGFGGGFGGNAMFPYMIGNNTQSDVQRGFDQSAVMSSLNGITGAISNGFANAEISRCNSQANILQTLNNNNNAVISGMNSLAMSLQNCCCDNRAGLADLKYTVATENCADRTALNEGLTNMMMANNANTQAIVNATNIGIQSIMDKICQLELDGKNDRIAELQTQLNEANRRASQTDQTAQILASQAAQTAALEQYLNPAPIPAYVVANPNCCPQYYTGRTCAA